MFKDAKGDFFDSNHTYYCLESYQKHIKMSQSRLANLLSTNFHAKSLPEKGEAFLNLKI